MGFIIERDAILYREWAPGAANAQLIGDFNGWDGNAGQMTRDKFGTWEIRIPHGASQATNQKHWVTNACRCRWQARHSTRQLGQGQAVQQRCAVSWV